jgi:hypothetical protein
LKIVGRNEDLGLAMPPCVDTANSFDGSLAGRGWLADDARADERLDPLAAVA